MIGLLVAFTLGGIFGAALALKLVERREAPAVEPEGRLNGGAVSLWSWTGTTGSVYDQQQPVVDPRGVERQRPPLLLLPPPDEDEPDASDSTL